MNSVCVALPHPNVWSTINRTSAEVAFRNFPSATATPEEEKEMKQRELNSWALTRATPRVYWHQAERSDGNNKREEEKEVEEVRFATECLPFQCQQTGHEWVLEKSSLLSLHLQNICGNVDKAKVSLELHTDHDRERVKFLVEAHWSPLSSGPVTKTSRVNRSCVTTIIAWHFNHIPA